MSSDKVDTIRSSSGGVVGRAQSVVRGQRLVLDSSSRPQPDALTNSEAFLAGISSCGVTLIEMYAQEKGIPVQRMDVTIEGVRGVADPSRVSSITMTFEIAGVSQAEAEALVETCRTRRPLYRTVAGATAVKTRVVAVPGKRSSWYEPAS